MACETIGWLGLPVRFFYVVYVFFFKIQKNMTFYVFLSCLTRFLEHWCNDIVRVREHRKLLIIKGVKWLKGVCSSSLEPISELRSVTGHTGPHSITYHPIQVNAPRLNPAKQAGISLFDLPTLEGWKAELTLVVGYIPKWFSLPVCSPNSLAKVT